MNLIHRIEKQILCRSQQHVSVGCKAVMFILQICYDIVDWENLSSKNAFQSVSRMNILSGSHPLESVFATRFDPVRLRLSPRNISNKSNFLFAESSLTGNWPMRHNWAIQLMHTVDMYIRGIDSNSTFPDGLLVETSFGLRIFFHGVRRKKLFDEMYS